MKLAIIDEHGVVHLVTNDIDTMDIEPKDPEDLEAEMLTSEDVINDIKAIVKQIKD